MKLNWQAKLAVLGCYFVLFGCMGMYLIGAPWLFPQGGYQTHISNISISPDGHKIAFSYWIKVHRPSKTETALYVIDADGGNLELLDQQHTNDGYFRGVKWSADSQVIRYRIDDNDQRTYFNIGANGRNRVELSNQELAHREIWYSLNATRLQNGYPLVDQIPLDEFDIDVEALPDNFDVKAATWSLGPDQETILYAASGDLFLTHISGNPVTQLTDSSDREQLPYWSPDGSKIAYLTAIPIAQYDSRLELNILDLNSRQKQLVASNEVRERSFRFSWSPNGEHFAFAIGNEVFIADSDGTNPQAVGVFNKGVSIRGWRQNSSGFYVFSVAEVPITDAKFIAIDDLSISVPPEYQLKTDLPEYALFHKHACTYGPYLGNKFYYGCEDEKVFFTDATNGELVFSLDIEQLIHPNQILMSSMFILSIALVFGVVFGPLMPFPWLISRRHCLAVATMLLIMSGYATVGFCLGTLVLFGSS